MAQVSLALKYRPSTFDDVTSQESIKIILKQQLRSNTFKHAYLFCGPAGCGKTTCARIFANEVNHHLGNPIEMDAASNNGVDDVRNIIQRAKTKSIESEYKVFIIDECHALSSNAWQAFLKLLEEPPAKTVFIFCTTDPRKIPQTIISRVQRFEFHRISQAEIYKRLQYIVTTELPDAKIERSALEYIAKLANGGMRDAISLLDKFLSYSHDITIENVVVVLGVSDYSNYIKLLNGLIIDRDAEVVFSIIEQVYLDGIDLKQFIRQFIDFVLDVSKYTLSKSLDFTSLPDNIEREIVGYDIERLSNILGVLIKLNYDIKWDNTPKAMIESVLFLECMK